MKTLFCLKGFFVSSTLCQRTSAPCRQKPGFADRGSFRLKGSCQALATCVLAAALMSCILADPNAVANRGDYAIDAYTPAADAAAQAEQRARGWWQRHAGRFGAQPPYLAVQTNQLLQGEIVQDLYAKMLRAKTSSLFFAQAYEAYPTAPIYGVVIFDARTGHLVGPQGYAVVDTPPRGSIARFGPYVARYIGTGR
jgi:hypothetical protein